MDQLPLVSIVTPNYNYARFLGETIESILRQDYPKIEYIVVDDGSTDHSCRIVRDYQCAHPGRIRLVCQANRGQSAALNHGFQLSSGQVLGWLNSDDLLEPSAVSIAVDYLLRHPDVGMVFADRLVIDQKGNFLYRHRGCYWGDWHFRNNCIVAQETSFWRRDLFFDCGALDESLSYCLDYDLFCRFSLNAQIGFVPVVTGQYRWHDRAKTVQVKAGMDQKGAQELQCTLQRYFGKRRNPLESWIIYSPLGELICTYRRMRARNEQERAKQIQSRDNFRWTT